MPRAAKNITGTVVSSSSSMTRGLVSPTYAATTSRNVAGGVCAVGSAEADWRTWVTGFLANDWGVSDPVVPRDRTGGFWLRVYRPG